MPADLSFISLVDDMQVTDIQEITNATPRAVLVTCRGDVRNTNTVKVNSVRIPTFTILNTAQLIIVIGDSFDSFAAPELDIEVVGLNWTGQKAVRLLFEISDQPETVSGVLQLIQLVVKTLITKVGSNRWRPGSGGNLTEGLGQAITAGSVSGVSQIVSQAVNRTKEEIIGVQATLTGLRTDERLLTLAMDGVELDEGSQAVRATLSLTTYSATQLTFPLTL